jgi:hypothetical protein
MPDKSQNFNLKHPNKDKLDWINRESITKKEKQRKMIKTTSKFIFI